MKESLLPKLVHRARIFVIYTRKVLAKNKEDNVFMLASSLSFKTMLAIIPLSAILFSLFSAFGALEGFQSTLQELVIEQLVPTRQDDILNMVNTFIDNSRTLGIIGLLSFLFTSVSLLNMIDFTFNQVYRSRAGQNVISRFMSYISVLVVGSFLTSLGLTVEGFIRGIFGREGLIPFHFLDILLQTVFPFLFLFLTISFLIIIIPKQRIQLRSAFIGGFCGALFWKFFAWIFSWFIGKAISISVVYGSIASIIIVLIWINYAWFIILVSLQIAFIHQFPSYRAGKAYQAGGNLLGKMQDGAKVFLTVAKNYAKEPGYSSIKQIVKDTNIASEDVYTFLDLFAETGLVHPLDGRRKHWVPARDLSVLTMGELISAITGLGSRERSKDSSSRWVASQFKDKEKTTVSEWLAENG